MLHLMSTSIAQKTMNITTTASGSGTSVFHGSNTTRTASASSSDAASHGFASYGSAGKLSQGVAVIIALAASKPFVSFPAHYSSRNQVIVVGLILMCAWQRHTKRRHAQKLPRGSVFFDSGSSQGTWALASQPERAESKAEASPEVIPSALMPARKPPISQRSDVAGSEFTEGHRSVYVDNDATSRGNAKISTLQVS